MLLLRRYGGSTGGDLGGLGLSFGADCPGSGSQLRLPVMKAHNIVATTLLGLVAVEALSVVHGEDSRAKPEDHTHQEDMRYLSADVHEVTVLAASSSGSTVALRGRAAGASSGRAKLTIR